jgi:hypothetical protein
MLVLASALALTAFIGLSLPMFSSSALGGSWLGGILPGSDVDERATTSSRSLPTPTSVGRTPTSGAANQAVADQALPTTLPSPATNEAGEPSSQYPPTEAASSHDVDSEPTSAPAAAPTDPPASPTPAPTQEPSTEISVPDVNPRSCRSDPGHPRYCTPTPAP